MEIANSHTLTTASLSGETFCFVRIVSDIPIVT